MRKSILILLILLISCQKNFYLEDLRKAEKYQEELLERISNLLIEKTSLLESNQELSNQISQLQEDLTNSSISLEEALELLNEYEQEITRLENYSPIEYEEIDTFLSTPASDAVRQVNVVVLNYIPTKDKGKTLDQSTFPFAGDNSVNMNLPIEEYKKWILSTTMRVKHGIEQGSRFRGYKNNSQPYVGIKVVKYINVYDMPKIPRDMPAVLFAQDGTEGYYPDYHTLFDSLNMETLVNEYNVKEIWFNRKSLALPESNMSSPTSGDVSNPFYGDSQYGYTNQIIPDDLPIYDKTYVVYSHWMHNGYSDILHIRGHQFERMFDRLEANYFLWGKFRGFSNTMTSVGQERGCGTVHYPVNATSDYQYNNSHFILSDIEDWKPDGTGQQTQVNNSNWIKNYIIPTTMPTSTYKSETSRNVIGNDPQGGWMIYWYQSFPGYQNGLSYNGHTLKNWWDTIFDWDYHFQNDKKLYQ